MEANFFDRWQVLTEPDLIRQAIFRFIVGQFCMPFFKTAFLNSSSPFGMIVDRADR